MPLPIVPILLLTTLSTGATAGTAYVGVKSIKPPAATSTYNIPLGKNVTPPKRGPKVPVKAPLTRTGTRPITR